MGHLSDNISRLMCKAGVSVHLRPYSIMKSMLVHLKDMVSKLDKTGVVYQIQCSYVMPITLVRLRDA